MFTLLHGENTLEQEEALTRLLTDPAEGFADLNTETLEAPLDFGELRRACDTLPFLGGKRIVIVKNALAQKNKKLWETLVDYLPNVPPSTQLVFLEDKTLSKRHPVLKLAKKTDAPVKHFAVPDERRELPRWIRERVKKRGGSIEPGAVALLAQNLGTRLHQLDQEIQKLLLYRAEEEGPITTEDVRLLVPYVESADVIFDLVDALGQRKPNVAARHLHRLLETGEHPLRIFGMIVRQYRLLIQVRWLMRRGKSEREIAKRLHLHPFVAKKTRGQATFFSHKQLRSAYDVLKTYDLSIKTGKLKPEAALELLVAELTRL